MTDAIPAGAVGNEQAIQIVRITWTSTDLMVPVEIKSSDPRFGSTDMERTEHSALEADPSLFMVPSSYTIRGRNR